MRNEKRDKNEPAIVAALLGLGVCTVHRLPGGKGRPDLLIGLRRTQTNMLMEVKMPGEDRNSLQQEFDREWACPIYVVSTEAEALQSVVDEVSRVVNSSFRRT